MSESPLGHERRNPSHPLRRARDYFDDGITRRRTWFKYERHYRLTYRRRPLITVLCTIAAVAATSVLAWGTTRVGSIYTDAAFAGSGWATCSAPISWTTDTSNLTPKQAAVVRPDLGAAFDAWAKASGLTFADGGELAVSYNDATTTVKPVKDISRNIAVYFVPDSKSSIITKNVVGYGSPSRVFAGSKEIVNGYIAVSTDYLVRTNSFDRRLLFMHELGHALGLADSDDPSNVMFRYLDTNLPVDRQIGSGDIEGIKAIEKVCQN
ncbi:MAG: matrixin family metalloprotease [Actinomycetota bacterium]|nr:matrixin family metalloprotease [Actinomycetota bacterium]